MTIQDQYLAYLQGLSDVVTSLELKIATLLRISQAGEDGTSPGIAPLLFTAISESLHVDIVLSLAKLYEDKSGRCLPRFLNFVEANEKQIVWGHLALSRLAVLRQRDAIKGHSLAIANVKAQRDKYFAHPDKEYFGEPQRLQNRFPIETDNVVDLLQVAQTILAEHSVALTGSARMSIGAYTSAHIEKMLTALQAQECRSRGDGDS